MHAPRRNTTGPTPSSARSPNANRDGPHSPPAQSPSVRQRSPLRRPPTQLADPHAPPPQSLSATQGWPGALPPAHARKLGVHVPPGQSRPVVHDPPAFVPPIHSGTAMRRAIRSTLVGASADPKKVVAVGSVGSACGSKIGGRLRPSGVKEPGKAQLGRGIGVPLRGNASSGVLPRSSRGTGTASRLTSTPRQSIGSKRLPAVSTVKRKSSVRPEQGGLGVVQRAW